jgi:hypothetical protein
MDAYKEVNMAELIQKDYAVIAGIKTLQTNGAISYCVSLELAAMVRKLGLEGARTMINNLKAEPAPGQARLKSKEECDKYLAILKAIETKIDAGKEAASQASLVFGNTNRVVSSKEYPYSAPAA